MSPMETLRSVQGPVEVFLDVVGQTGPVSLCACLAVLGQFPCFKTTNLGSKL